MDDNKRKIAQGIENEFNNASEDKPKEKLFCPIDADLKIRVNLHKVKNKVTLTNIVEAALSQYLEKEEEK